MAQWLERCALSMSLPGAEFSEKYHASPLSILGHFKDVVSLGKALCTMAMCTISLMRRNGCRTVCSQWS